jgi:DNA-binding NarL/FixJ family response regulator
MVKRLKPDLVVIDISLPDQSGIQLARDLRERLSEIKILIVSMHSKIDYIAEAFQAGATGYVVKESASERLLQGLKSVAKGDYYLDSSVSHAVVENLMKSPLKAAKITDADYATLTPREQEVMRLLAEGLSSKAVAEKLFISPKTVENHRANIMNKLGLHSTIELVRYAAKLGLIDVDLWKD